MEYIVITLLAISFTSFVVYLLANKVFQISLSLKALLLCAVCALILSIILPRLVVSFAGLAGTVVFLAFFAVIFAYIVAYYDTPNLDMETESALSIPKKPSPGELLNTALPIDEVAFSPSNNNLLDTYSNNEPIINSMPLESELNVKTITTKSNVLPIASATTFGPEEKAIETGLNPSTALFPDIDTQIKDSLNGTITNSSKPLVPDQAIEAALEDPALPAANLFTDLFKQLADNTPIGGVENNSESVLPVENSKPVCKEMVEEAELPTAILFSDVFKQLADSSPIVENSSEVELSITEPETIDNQTVEKASQTLSNTGFDRVDRVAEVIPATPEQPPEFPKEVSDVDGLSTSTNPDSSEITAPTTGNMEKLLSESTILLSEMGAETNESAIDSEEGISLSSMDYSLSDSLDDLLDFAFQQKETGNNQLALDTFRRAFNLYHESDAAPLLAIEISKLLMNQGAYDEAISFLTSSRNLSGITRNSALDNELVSTIAYLRIIKNTLMQRRTGYLPFNQIPADITEEIDLEFREWRVLS
ncbi:MAG: hypothetical protein H6Q67_122 [Firmicutes bacterium]|nr:hypothetical protein [Bacillota bacterium]